MSCLQSSKNTVKIPKLHDCSTCTIIRLLLVHCKPVQYSTVQYCAVKHSSMQYSTALCLYAYCTVQQSRSQRNWLSCSYFAVHLDQQHTNILEMYISFIQLVFVHNTNFVLTYNGRKWVYSRFSISADFCSFRQKLAKLQIAISPLEK